MKITWSYPKIRRRSWARNRWLSGLWWEPRTWPKLNTTMRDTEIILDQVRLFLPHIRVNSFWECILEQYLIIQSRRLTNQVRDPSEICKMKKIITQQLSKKKKKILKRSQLKLKTYLKSLSLNHQDHLKLNLNNLLSRLKKWRRTKAPNIRS